MEHRILNNSSQDEVSRLFTTAFAASESEKEGRLIGKLASALAAQTDNQDIICYAPYDADTIIGCILFSRLVFKQAPPVFMLAPVAVGTTHQGKGIGKSLINYGLSDMRRRSAEVAVTYGDPSFYYKIGFHSLSEKVIQAPRKLSMPEGWLSQSLSGAAIPIINKRPSCVKEFNDPAYW